MVVSPVRQTHWTPADHVWCEKQATAWSVTASVVNYLYFAVIGDRHVGYTPVRITGILVIMSLSSALNSLCFRYEGDKLKGLYDGRGVAYFTGGHFYEVYMELSVDF